MYFIGEKSGVRERERPVEVWTQFEVTSFTGTFHSCVKEFKCRSLMGHFSLRDLNVFISQFSYSSKTHAKSRSLITSPGFNSVGLGQHVQCLTNSFCICRRIIELFLCHPGGGFMQRNECDHQCLAIHDWTWQHSVKTV